jgi:hypothetical protein
MPPFADLLDRNQDISTCIVHPFAPCARNKLLFGVQSVLAIQNEYKKPYTYSSKNGTEDGE